MKLSHASRKLGATVPTEIFLQLLTRDDIGDFKPRIEELMRGAKVRPEEFNGLVASAEKARIALENANKRIDKVRWKLPAKSSLEEYIALQEEAGYEVRSVITRFERRLSYKVATNKVLGWIGLSSKRLEAARKLIKVLAAVKTGGASLLS